jgi:hypothetical protein
MAGKTVKGEMKHQRVSGKIVKITVPQRRRWLLVAGQTAEIIQGMMKISTSKK